MQQAALMQYDDDFDEEEMFAGRRAGGEGRTYGVQLVQPKAVGIEIEKKGMDNQELDLISEIGTKKTGKKNENGEDEEVYSSEDDLIDEMTKFVEGNDLELVKDRSNLVEEDDKVKRLRQMR